MPKFRKRPVVVEAMQVTRESFAAVAEWAGVEEFWGLDAPTPSLHIRTLEGVMHAKLGWWVIRGVAGEFYPCEPAIFAATYEEV